jgi:hypothetical protein
VLPLRFGGRSPGKTNHGIPSGLNEQTSRAAIPTILFMLSKTLSQEGISQQGRLPAEWLNAID